MKSEKNDPFTDEMLELFGQNIYDGDKVFLAEMIDGCREKFDAMDVHDREDRYLLSILLTNNLIGQYVTTHWNDFRKQIPDYIRKCFEGRVMGEFWELYCDEYADKDEED